MKGKFYITTAIPYVNAKPHMGHAFEFAFADAVARFHRVHGEDVLVLSGSDENALKNVRAAEKAGADVKTFIAANTELFIQLALRLGVDFDVFQKGGSEIHHSSSQKLWELCEKSGDIYKKLYEGLYCVGCEAFYTPDELSGDGECYEHPGIKLEIVSEENYFFRLSKYQTQLIELVSSNALAVVPKARKNEVLGFLKQPLHDISISRSNERAKNWGVRVPGDDLQRMYVWFDALNIYQSGVGFGWNEDMYLKWWPADLHIIGKGIIRFHAIYWPAFLLSAKLSLPRRIFVHGYITIQGQKMSKTIGNIIDPNEIIEKFGKEAARYLLLSSLPFGRDADIDLDKLSEKYNADLANGLGNLVARLAALGEKISPIIYESKKDIESGIAAFSDEVLKNYTSRMNNLRIGEALTELWRLIGHADKYINEKKPWAITDEKELRRVIVNASHIIGMISNLLAPFLPETARKIQEQIAFHDSTLEIKRGAVLFPRLG